MGNKKNKNRVRQVDLMESNQTNTAAQNTLGQNANPDFSNDALPSTSKMKLNVTSKTIMYDEDSFFFLIHFKQLQLMVEKYSCCQFLTSVK